MRAPRTLKITREGRYYLGFTLGVGVAATNTGNNLLFLILGMLLALIIVSGLLSEAALRRLSVTRAPIGPFRAGEPGLLPLLLRNGNRLLPSIGMEIAELPVTGARSVPGRCLRIMAGTTARTTIRLTPERRGEFRLEGLVVTTRYPFGIFAKSRRYYIPATVLAWPARVGARKLEARIGRDEVGPPVERRGGVEDLRGLRRFRDGDELRLVHWRRSLRVGRMLIVERDAPEGRRVLLRLSPGTGEPFEEAVRATATRAEDHIARGDEVGLEAPAGFSVAFGGGLGHRRRLLSALALVPQLDDSSVEEPHPGPAVRAAALAGGPSVAEGRGGAASRRLPGDGGAGR